MRTIGQDMRAPHSGSREEGAGAGRRHGTAVRAYLSGYRKLQAVLTRRTGCAANAADIVQETYLRLEAVEGGRLDNPEAYVGRVATNIATDWQRRAMRAPAIGGDLPLDIASEAPSAERELLARERLRAVLMATEKLPPKCREVFLLRKIEGLEQQEIAQRLGISMNMVQKHLRKALADIMALVGPDE